MIITMKIVVVVVVVAVESKSINVLLQLFNILYFISFDLAPFSTFCNREFSSVY